jgi:hypothetical protein
MTTTGDDGGRERRRVTEQWPDIQITRAIASLENGQTDIRNDVRGLRDAIDALPDRLGEQFLRQETYRADEQRRLEVRHAIEKEHEELAKWTADIAASLERVWRSKVDRKTVWSVLGVAVGLLTVAATIVAAVIR